MGLFTNRTSSVIIPAKRIEEDRVGYLLKEAKEENTMQPLEFTAALNLFKTAMTVLSTRINATFSISVKESKVIMLKLDDWQIYWLIDDPEYITLETKGRFDKITADQETFVYTIQNLDTF